MSDKLSEAQLESFINEACESLRGDRDAASFIEYVIAIVFLKRLNDRFNLDREIRRFKLKQKGSSPEQIAEDLERREAYRLFVPQVARWDTVKLQNEDLGDYLMKAFAEIDAVNPNCIGLLNTVDFTKKNAKGENYISSADLKELIQKFDGLRLSDDNLDF